MGKTTILYVDDDEALAETVRETLTRGGYEVLTDTDAQRALRGFSKEPGLCDLAILDHKMPRMKGLELARWLRLCRPGLPVIIVTGFPEMLSPRETERTGIGEVLVKPLLRPELFAAIERALERAESEKEKEKEKEKRSACEDAMVSGS